MGAAPAARRFEIEGRSLGYPTEFRDGSCVGGLFAVRARIANGLIAESGFEVAEIAPGRAVLAFTGIHYTDTDCGSYHETAFAFFVREPGGSRRLPYVSTWADLLRGRVASFTWRLQVDTVLAQQAGRRMWGFPKTLEEIDFERSEDRAVVTLRMGGETVLRYAVRARGSREPAPVTSTVYSIHQGAPHVSRLTQRYRGAGQQLGGGALEVGAQHPLARDLRSLGLPKRPWLATWAEHLEFRMSAPEKL